jgi:hypothetical protein
LKVKSKTKGFKNVRFGWKRSPHKVGAKEGVAAKDKRAIKNNLNYIGKTAPGHHAHTGPLGKCHLPPTPTPEFFVCVVLEFEFRAYTLSHSTSPFFVIDFLEIGSWELFAHTGFKLRSS